MHLLRILAVVGVLFVAGCSSTGALQMSSDTYMISKQSSGGVFADMGKLKAKVIREANEFAASKGKVAVPLNAEVRRPPVGFPSFEYQFLLVDKDDPRAKGGSLVPRADLVIEKSEKISVDVQTKDLTVKNPDMYAELMKLDDLRKKGVLTEEEFQAQKQKILEQSK